jgi:ATP-binding cassette subfamily B protein/ATP-binding cassette subfamily C protein LapB
MPAIGSLLEKYKQILSYRDLLSSSYVLALADLPFLLLFLFAIMVEAGPLALVAVVCGTVMILVSLALTPPALDYDRSARAAGERRFGLIADLLSSREAVVGGALQERLAERWRQASATAAHGASQARYWRGLAGSFNSSLSYVSFIAVLVGGAYMIEDHTLTSGGLLAASMLTSRAMGMFGSAITLLTRYREFRIALRELNQLVPVSAATRRTRDYGRLRGAVRVEHVTCRLRPDVKPVLREVDFAIGAGEIVGIAGAPGAGKTSLLRMLVGVVLPEEGRILIDDIPIERLSPSDLSLNVGFKPQEYGLFDGTVEDNVRAGRGALTAETRADVLAVSGLHRAFEDGSLNWTTEVGARGGNLSGGQRQLVALARALLTRPPLILLDEPTNGLDSALEAHLAAQLRRLRGASTIIVSTHSRNLLQICDRIIVVGQSKLLANGPRDQILV